MSGIVQLMARGGGPRRWVSRGRSIVLLAALLPMLSYAGHWEIDLPWLPAAPAGPAHHHEHDAHAEGEAHRHGEHCHGRPSSCSDVPFTGASAFALAGHALAVLGAAGRLRPVAVAAWAPHRSRVVAPEPHPPQPRPLPA